MSGTLRYAIAVIPFALLTGLAAPASADDVKTCTNLKASADDVIRACTRLQKKQSGASLTYLLTYRLLAHIRKSDLDAALRDADLMIRNTPASSIGFKFRGNVWSQKGDFERAKRDLDDAIRLNPKDPDAYNDRGIVLYKMRQNDQAIADYDLAIKLDPKTAQFFGNRASSWIEKSDDARALADLNEAIRIDRTNPGFYGTRGGIYLKMGDLDRALAEYDQLAKLDAKNFGAFAGRGAVWRARGEYDRAIAEFDRALERDPDDATVYVVRGLTRESKGDVEAAKRDFKLALNVNPSARQDGGSLNVINVRPAYDRSKAIAEARLKVLEASVAPKQDAAPQPAAPPSPSNIKERRIALVIGNGAYTGAGKLANPSNDAAAVAKALRGIGFEVSEGIDLDTKTMKDTINDFLRRASTASMALMFYAGHGMQIGGKNYLLPTDIRTDSGDAMMSGVSDLDTILAGLDDQLRTNVVILDACRDNPTLQQSQVTVASRSVQVRSGLAAQSGLGAGATIGAGTLIAFATAPGQVALDGDGANSPFSSALARHISTPGLEVQQMLTRVRSEVVAATKNKQVPWSNSSLLGEVFLVGSR